MQQSVGARVDQIYKVEMADLQGYLQEILSRSSYVEFAGTHWNQHWQHESWNESTNTRLTKPPITIQMHVFINYVFYCVYITICNEFH